jgi:hypothetical protein
MVQKKIVIVSALNWIENRVSPKLLDRTNTYAHNKSDIVISIAMKIVIDLRNCTIA